MVKQLVTISALLFNLLGYLPSSAQGKQEITLEDIYVKGTFKGDFVSGFRSMKDGKHYTELVKNKIEKKRFEDGELSATILDLGTLKYDEKSIEIDEYEFNEDESKLLLLSESEAIYRRSVLHKVYIYDLKTSKLSLLHQDKVLHATFSPLSDKVAYVYKNNLYIKNLEDEEEIQVTDDGSYNIINGNCDWVYEEEFEFTKAYEWSPKGDYIAFYRFDQTAVPEYNFAIYDKLYPTDYKFKYPKAGEKNSIVDIYLYHLEKDKILKADLSSETDIYFPRLKMNPFDNTTIVYRLNRLQNHLELLQVNPKKGTTQLILEEKNPYYVEINDNILFLKDKNAFVFTSERSAFTHIYLHDLETQTTTAVTSGNWEVTDIKGIDEKSNSLYFVSTEKSPLERHLYSIQLDGSGKRIITPEPGWHDITFSENFEYYLERHSSLNQLSVYSLVNKMGNKRMLKNNEALSTKMKQFDLGAIELITIPNEEGTLLNAWMIKPSNFSNDRKHPVLMFQYSGPGSQSVSNQFVGRDFWWYQMLAQKGYIIVCVDGTGTGYRGEAFKKKTYLQLGKYESDDQIAAAKYLAKQSYVDSARIGIWGWSYGGYMSSICLLKGADVFKCAIAVAPVTNWRYYDNIYTERYMRTPQENAQGYDDNSPVNLVKNLKGSYLLIHGTADDNVHYQNAIEMQDALIKANKEFDSEAYPDKNHGISGGNTRLHLYKRMTKFILENL